MSQTATPIDEKGAPAVGWRFAVVFAAAVALSAVVAGVALDRAGVAARVVPSAKPSIVVVDDAPALLDAWNRAGVHGAVLVDVTRDLGYAIPQEAFPVTSGWPVPLLDLQSVFRSAVERPNVVWIASRTGIARSVAYVLEPRDLGSKVRAGQENGWPGISPDGRSITANDEGYLRRIESRFPAQAPEAPILNIDASYFVNATPEELVGLLDSSGVSYRFVTLNRAVDATDVPQAARTRLDRMADILRERESR